jgi:hypothetical protein
MPTKSRVLNETIAPLSVVCDGCGRVFTVKRLAAGKSVAACNVNMQKAFRRLGLFKMPNGYFCKTCRQGNVTEPWWR